MLTSDFVTGKGVAQRGFTLIEAMVVVSIIGVLLMAVLPGAATWIRSLRVRSAAESLQNGLQRARMEALRRNQEVSFWLMTNPTTDGCALSAGTGSWAVSLGSTSPAGSCATTPPLEAYSMPGASSTVQVSGVNGANGVTFNVFGQVKASGTPLQKIQVTMPTSSDVKELDVYVTPGGLVRMCDPSVGKADSRACPDAS